jgi:ribosome-associated translation inhibitor RaiA
MNRTAAFPPAIGKPAKRSAGRTRAEETPLNLRTSGVEIKGALRTEVRARTAARLGKFAHQIERATVRFVDVNGPRGGVDTACRIKIVLSSAPSVVTEERAEGVREAFAAAIAAAARQLQRVLARRGFRGPARRARGSRETQPAVVSPANPPPEDGSLIGRRVGRARANLLRAADRPEKRRRDALVDTAQPETSATDRRAGGGSTARRNTRLNSARATATLEDSASGRPSRKSTRRSANRAKQDDQLRLRAALASQSPSGRAR